jgi:hypothetical protein
MRVGEAVLIPFVELVLAGISRQNWTTWNEGDADIGSSMSI